MTRLVLAGVSRLLAPALLCGAFTVFAAGGMPAQAAPVGERSSVGESAVAQARQLVAEGRQREAIDRLRTAVEQQPADLSARSLLARLLSWSGALNEAVWQAAQVLAVFPDHDEALRTRADASAWRGDFATALPLYRRYLEHYPSDEGWLGYGHALVSAGYLEAAALAAAAIEQQTEPGSELLDQRLQRAQAPVLLLGGTRYQDSDDSTRTEIRAGVEKTLSDVGLGMLVETVDAASSGQRSEARRALLSTGARLTDWLVGSAALGVAQVSDDSPGTGAGGGSDRSYLTGRLSSWMRSGDLGLRLRLERDLFDETATILGNSIRRDELELQLDYAASDRIRLAGQLTRAGYSDSNASTEIEFTPQVALRLQDPGIRLGYRRTELRFDQQTGSGYFDPDRVVADRLMLFATVYRPWLQGDAELFAGQQTVMRFGSRQDQFIAGGSARLEVDVSRRTTVGLEVEGGNFDLQSPTGFTYWLATVNLLFRL